MSVISSPHDHFFRQAMSHTQVAEAFFDSHLPVAVKEAIDLTTLNLRKGSFVDQELKLSITDMLYSVKITGQEGYLYLLVEHQSKSDKMMPFRIFKYMLRIMEQHLKEKKSDKLPLVYPLVFYNGKAVYSYSTDMLDLFEDCDLAREIMFKPFQLIDVNRIPDEVLKQNTFLGLMELCMKYIYAQDILPYLPKLSFFLDDLTRAGYHNYIKAALTYLSIAGEISDKNKFVEVINNNFSEKAGEKLMTIAELFKAEGKAEAEYTIALRMIKRGIPLSTVSQIIELSPRELQELEKNFRQDVIEEVDN